MALGADLLRDKLCRRRPARLVDRGVFGAEARTWAAPARQPLEWLLDRGVVIPLILLPILKRLGNLRTEWERLRVWIGKS